MSIPSLCKSISSNLYHNLRLASSDDERHSYAAKALQHAGDQVFSALDDLRAEKGEDSVVYGKAQHVVLELLAMIGIPYVRCSSSFPSAVASLEEQARKSGDPQVKKKLATYANQLKKKWNHLEPGGIQRAPGAIRLASASDSAGGGFFSYLVAILFGGALLFILMQFDLTSAIIPGWDRPLPQGSSSATDLNSEPRENPPPATPIQASVVPDATHPIAEPVRAKAGDYCRYTDEKGVINIVNDPTQVPVRYRQRMEVIALDHGNGGGVTQVAINGNRVLVPVTLKNRGREVKATLLLDTGATTTTIGENIAHSLGLGPSDVKAGTTTVADGRALVSYSFATDSVSVGNRTLPGTMVSILTGSGGNGADGLLGMNFLKEFRYNIDFKRGVIEWGN